MNKFCENFGFLVPKMPQLFHIDQIKKFSLKMQKGTLIQVLILNPKMTQFSPFEQNMNFSLKKFKPASFSHSLMPAV